MDHWLGQCWRGSRRIKDRLILLATIVLLLLITLLALGLRLYRLDAQSLWYDEGFSAYLARMNPAEITDRTAADIQPPLYYYLLHGWIKLLGDEERALRSLSLLCGVLVVPLMYAVAWQLFHTRLAGLLAALLIAVAPLHVWYSQETRMYTLFTLLCLLSSYLLLVVIPLVIQKGKKWKILVLWTVYTLVNIAALYTHYFAVFVMAFQALYLLLVWAGRGLRPARLILGGVFSVLFTFLAFLPWLPHLATRYGTDASFWPGQLKVFEALLDIAISFVGGESVLEPVGIVLATGYGVVFIFCFLALLLHGLRVTSHESRNSPYPLGFLLLYLLVPPALILALSSTAPKFNARYVMVSHPAVLLIVAGGLAALWQRRTSRLGNWLCWTLAAIALAFVLSVSAYANANAYFDPAFARADFRGVTRYLGKHIAPDETIILSSGHMYPVFDYYAAGVERHLLPDSATLDTTRTLDYSIASDLKEWLTARGGVWVVLWQDDVVDPAGYLTTILGEVGEEQPVDRGFAKVKVRHYRLSEDSIFSEQPAIAHPADYNFGNRLRLLGYTQTGDRQVTLFWEALQPLEEDYRVSLTLRDTMGQSWGQWDGRPTAYFYPTDRWPVGPVVFGRHDLTPLPGAPPGDYGLEVGVYTEDDPIGLDIMDDAGAPQGKRAMLGAVKLAVPTATVDDVEIPNPGRIDLG
ncbi:glycosyltransferase family 39 protein, partial [Chloroflexota bacterium]